MKIEIKNVTKKFKDVEILKNINLSFEEGKIYGLVGRNGSGKSVLLKLLCSFYSPTTGEILYDSIDINKEKIFPPSTRALIEKPNFMPELTGKENLLLLASIQNLIGEDEVDEVLKLVDLYEDKDKKYHKYSLGMKQKLGIAQVLMEDPKILILDEPFNGLDDKSSQKIRQILLDEKKNKKIIIIATHIQDDVKILCDEIYKIDGGEITLLKNKNEI
ncbi:MAG: ABC transporter ATP-binding protein [Mycoplasmatota bacterium]|nr:ABC transporter ATP-binding protein [Mycoplasmatota bacterium]